MFSTSSRNPSLYRVRPSNDPRAVRSSNDLPKVPLHSVHTQSSVVVGNAEERLKFPHACPSTTVLITMRRSASMAAGEMASEQSRDEPSKRGYRSRVMTLRP